MTVMSPWAIGLSLKRTVPLENDCLSLDRSVACQTKRETLQTVKQGAEYLVVCAFSTMR